MLGESSRLEWRLAEQSGGVSRPSGEAEEMEARQGATVLAPLVLVLFVLLFSPLLYDLLCTVR